MSRVATECGSLVQHYSHGAVLEVRDVMACCRSFERTCAVMHLQHTTPVVPVTSVMQVW